jgi:phospholipid-binding lipoprotein MlaA
MKQRIAELRRFVLAAILLALAAPGGAQTDAAQSPTSASAAAAAEEEEDEFVDEYATAAAAPVSDPFERVNRTMFKFNNSVYTRVLRPVSRGYQSAVPEPARRGMRNFFDNIEYPVRFISCVLQGKLDRAGAETGKFALNSTIGLAGFIKVSDRYPALRVPEEDIGQVLGTWGFGPGPFLVLPVLGPSSIRDGIGRVGDAYATPTNWRFMRHEESWIRTTLIVGDVLVGLPVLLATHDALQRSAVDPYVAFRNAYLQYREGEVAR